jgi:hypothetical protein
VVKTPDADKACQEIATRIIAELTADGVPVVALTCSASDPACSTVSGERAAAIVSVQLRDSKCAVQVRANDAAGVEPGGSPGAVGRAGRVQRIADVESGGTPAALAVRTVELLKAMLLEVADPPVPEASVAQLPDEEAAAHDVQADVQADPEADSQADAEADASAQKASGPSKFTMNIGAAMIGSFGGLSPAYGPALSVGRRTSDHVLLSVFLAGPAFGRDQRNPAGSVSVRHELAALQADLMGVFWSRIVLRAGIGAGLYHIQIDGQPTMATPKVGRSDGGFSWMLSWSAGVVANLRSDIGLFVDGRMFVLTPTPVVLLNGLEVGRAGNPGISITTGVEIRL